MTMRYALISDIHANLPALEAVLADIAARPDIAATYHLGDLVGYSPWPNEAYAATIDGCTRNGMLSCVRKLNTIRIEKASDVAASCVLTRSGGKNRGSR